ncbi:hypothetical protein [Streptomyces sp. NPDC001315]|uniref:hypothetical protein n=1 Tax=Streptomyces sp. NPDC001315 TaxID=3364562 RepID=UPI0036A7C3A0
MALHDFPHTPTGRRVLVALASAGVALGAGAGTAAAAADPVADVTKPAPAGRLDPQAGLQGVRGSVRYVTGPVQELKPNPLAGTGADPLDNGVGTQVADFRPVTSQGLTRPVAQAKSVGSVPVVGQAMGRLGG